MRWLKETKRLCWRLVCFLLLHTAASSNASSPGNPLESFRLSLEVDDQDDVPEMEVQTQFLALYTLLIFRGLYHNQHNLGNFRPH